MRRVMVAVFVLGAAPQAFAQRAAEYTSQVPPVEARSSGFPGIFDTAMAPTHDFVLSIPTSSIDFGVSENFTVGTNGVPYLALIAGKPGGSLKLRYRFFSTRELAAVVTGYAGMFTTDIRYGMVTANVSYHFSARTLATATLIGVRINVRGEDELAPGVTNKSTSTSDLAGAGLSFEHFFGRVLGFQATIFALPYGSDSLEDATGKLNVGVSMGEAVLARSFARLLVEIRAGRWLLTPGIMTSLDSPALIPLFEAMWRF